MLHILSPAKSLDFESNVLIVDFTIPKLKNESSKLISNLRKIKAKELEKLMSISSDLAGLNTLRYAKWKGLELPGEESRQALFAFKGDVYVGLDAYSLNQKEIAFAQDHCRILSGLYGVLNPLDIIEPYRLEMGTKLSVSKTNNLYQFWEDKPTKLINEQLQAINTEFLINLASNEYFKVINKKLLKAKVIAPQFKDAKNGNYKVISFYAKKARGLMSRFLIQNEIKHPNDLKAFNSEGYCYNEKLSKENEPVFTREENQQ